MNRYEKLLRSFDNEALAAFRDARIGIQLDHITSMVDRGTNTAFTNINEVKKVEEEAKK